MKFEEFYIELDAEHESEIVKILESMGFSKKQNYDSNKKFISTYATGKIGTVNYHNFCFQPLYTFEKFMEKYGSNTMIEKINQAKKQLNFNNKQLSEALGYSRQYITKMLNIPQSEKIQDKVCKEIDALLNCKDNTVSNLQKENEALKLSNSKLVDNLNRAEKLHIEDEKLNAAISKSIDEKTSQIVEQQEEILVLNKQIEDANVAIDILDKQIIDSDEKINELERSLKTATECESHWYNQFVKNDIDLEFAKDRITCERWLFLIIIAILFAVVIFK